MLKVLNVNRCTASAIVVALGQRRRMRVRFFWRRHASVNTEKFKEPMTRVSAIAAKVDLETLAWQQRCLST